MALGMALGGTGYYFGSVSGSTLTDLYPESQNPSQIALRLIWKYESEVNTFGCHAGTSMDFDLGKNISLYFETFYRSAKFKKFNTALREVLLPHMAQFLNQTGEDLGEDTTFFYAQKFIYGVKDLEYWKDIDYRLFILDISGLTFRF